MRDLWACLGPSGLGAELQDPLSFGSLLQDGSTHIRGPYESGIKAEYDMLTSVWIRARGCCAVYS